MRIFPARKNLIALSFVIFLLFAFFNLYNLFVLPTSVLAQEQFQLEANKPTPTPALPPANKAQWAFDPEVTEVGKGADRARQLLWWVFSHPGVHTAPVFAQIWAFSRNIVYTFVILIVVAFGFSFILLRKRASSVNIPPILVKIGAVLIYVTFSYVIILALVQISDIVMKFFIERVGGQNLFNVIFAGPNIEQNYISFVGYRDTNLMNREMVNTSLFLIRLTSLTYYVMALIIILRTIILWFLLIISPFLGLLMPFVFIRNIGWIWIGVFFQWLFYGPLLALFLGTLTNVWVQGIPYPFDFSKVNQVSGQVYRTAINILYGGPAQTLSAGNSANYVDTFAEYIIALVMLWATMILPWLLLRIFRDYCCELIAAGNATLSGIFDRIRQYPPPPQALPTIPATSAGIAVELPFRTKVEEKIKEVQRTKIEEVSEISRTHTTEIMKAMDLSVSSLADVSRYEMDQVRRDEVAARLQKIATPENIASPVERERFAQLRSELKTRAMAGDRQAARLMSVTGAGKDELVSQVAVMAGGRGEVAGLGRTKSSFAPAVGLPTVQTVTQLSQISVPTIANKLGISESKIQSIVSMIPTIGALTPQNITKIAQKTGASEANINQVISIIQSSTVTTPVGKVTVLPTSIPVSMGGKVIQTQVSIEDYEEVKKMWLKHYREAPVPTSDFIKTREGWLESDIKKLTNISDLLASNDPKLKQKGFEEVSELLPFLLLGGFSDAETLTYIKAKLEAAKQIQEELGIAEKVKAEVKGKAEEEFVEIAGKKEKVAKQATLKAEEKLKIPHEPEKNLSED